jgi:hypothetical protein
MALVKKVMINAVFRDVTPCGLHSINRLGSVAEK